MADEPTPATPPEYGSWFENLDELGKTMVEQIRANEALLRGIKYEYGQDLLRAQQGDGEVPDASVLLQIKKIELQIHNDKMYLEARELTRRHQ